MRVHLSTLLVLTALIVGSFAQQIQGGAKMEVKPGSIWFLEVGNLSTWQKLKKAGNPAEFESYQTKELGARHAWQFTKPLTVKIISFEPQKNQAIHIHKAIHFRNAPSRFPACHWIQCSKDHLCNSVASSTAYETNHH
jgi:hypothetical protein